WQIPLPPAGGARGGRVASTRMNTPSPNPSRKREGLFVLSPASYSLPMTDTPDRPALAYHLTVGKGPPVVFLPGYASDMSGSKAVALEEWAKTVGRTFLRFDYAGCGASEGAF